MRAAEAASTQTTLHNILLLLGILAVLVFLVIFLLKCVRQKPAAILAENELLNKAEDSIGQKEETFPKPVDYEPLGKKEGLVKQIMDDILLVAADQLHPCPATNIEEDEKILEAEMHANLAIFEREVKGEEGPFIEEGTGEIQTVRIHETGPDY